MLSFKGIAFCVKVSREEETQLALSEAEAERLDTVACTVRVIGRRNRRMVEELAKAQGLRDGHATDGA